MEKEKSIGALWAKKSGKGVDYFSGNIEVNGQKLPIVAFYNSNKKNPKEPDYRILLSKPRDEAQENNPLPTRPEEELTQEEIDSIPF